MCSITTTPARLPEITGPSPTVAPERPTARPLDILARALRSGAALAWEHDTFVLRAPGGELTRGVRLDELALVLAAAAGELPSKPRTMISLNRSTLRGVARVLCTGETLSGFIRSAMAREIAARLAQEELELQEGGHA